MTRWECWISLMAFEHCSSKSTMIDSNRWQGEYVVMCKCNPLLPLSSLFSLFPLSPSHDDADDGGIRSSLERAYWENAPHLLGRIIIVSKAHPTSLNLFHPKKTRYFLSLSLPLPHPLPISLALTFHLSLALFYPSVNQTKEEEDEEKDINDPTITRKEAESFHSHLSLSLSFSLSLLLLPLPLLSLSLSPPLPFRRMFPHRGPPLPHRSLRLARMDSQFLSETISLSPSPPPPLFLSRNIFILSSFYLD